MAAAKSDELAAELRRRIGAGAWSEGGRLPTERMLAEEFGVARNTVRRAFQRLEGEGVLARQVGRGTYLRQAAQADPLLRIARQIAGASPADMMELRLLVEPPAAAVAATSASDAELAAIEEAHHRAVAATGMAEFERWDSELHQAIFACTRNDLLRQTNALLTLLRNQPRWVEMKQRSFSETRRRSYCAQHERVIRALRRRHPEAAQEAMRRHLGSVQGFMFGR